MRVAVNDNYQGQGDTQQKWLRRFVSTMAIWSCRICSADLNSSSANREVLKILSVQLNHCQIIKHKNILFSAI